MIRFDLILIRKDSCFRQVIVLRYVNLAVTGHKKPSQIALGGCRALNVHFLPLEFQGLLEFLFGQFMNQKANWKVEDRNDSVAEPSHHYYFKNIGLDIWNPFV